MKLDQTNISEVKGLLEAARSRDINFGICLGAKPDDIALKLHKPRL